MPGPSSAFRDSNLLLFRAGLSRRLLGYGYGFETLEQESNPFSLPSQSRLACRDFV
jgi:hypothetical protein